jgi:hypothetical protein
MSKSTQPAEAKPRMSDNNSIYCRKYQHKQQLKKQGRAKFAERIAHLRRLADAMQAVLDEEEKQPEDYNDGELQK